jgi:hypothetical protein
MHATHGPIAELRYVLDLSEMAELLAPTHGSLHEVATAINASANGTAKAIAATSLAQ